MRKGKPRGKFFLTLIIVLIVTLLTGGIQFFLWSNHVKKAEADWTAQVAELETALANVGELVTVFTVVEPVNPGDVIFQTNLRPIQIPSAFVGGSYVLDPKEVVDKFYKVAVKPGTPLTGDLVMEEKIDNTTREVDITAITWPVGLKNGDYVDLEIIYPMGEIYTVLSHVRVNEVNSATLKVKLSGVERHLYSAALVDYFLNSKNGATLSMTKYVEPGVQTPAQVYYAVPQNILSIITADPNIITKVDAAVTAQRRAMIEKGVASVTDQVGGAISAGRADLANKTNAASNAFWQAEKDRLEKEALDAAAAAGDPNNPANQQPATQPQGQEGENLNIEKGVVD